MSTPSASACCLDKRNPDYFGYYRFKDEPGLFEQMVDDISSMFAR